MRRSVLIAAVAIAVLSGAARADDQPDAATQAAVQDVISKQFDAFRSEDGAAAEAFAAPGIQQKFPSPDIFMGMVRTAYPALIRPRSTHFDSLTVAGETMVQKVTIVGSDGQTWTAAYTMTLVDGQWRISGCSILKAEGVNA